MIGRDERRAHRADMPTRDRKIRIDGAGKQAFEDSRVRLLITAALFGVAFVVIGFRLVQLGLYQNPVEPRTADGNGAKVNFERADIVDRNGIPLATNLETQSLYANPSKMEHPEEATAKLVKAFPDLDRNDVYRKLTSGREFIWLKRKMTPRQAARIPQLGIPGVWYQPEMERVYPQGRLAAHVVGMVNIDNKGLGGIERYYNTRLNDPAYADKPLALSIDVRVQHAMRDELVDAVKRFDALGAAGIVMDVHTGEVLAMVSLPDYDPNNPGATPTANLFNRATFGVYEMGSTFKIFNTAMALESGLVKISDKFDATEPLHIARFTINDDHAKKRWLTVPEIFVYSSNIGSARMAVKVGSDWQQSFLRSLGLMNEEDIELPERGRPEYPVSWGEISTMTISYGHGMAVTPLHLATAASAMVNGGILYRPTLIKIPAGKTPEGKRVVSEETSKELRGLMRLVVEEGTGRQAEVPGYMVGGKTGSAEKPSKTGGYQLTKLVSSFVGAFPMDNPRYVVLATIDEPHGTKKTFGYRTAGWNAAPVVGHVIARLATILDVPPQRGIQQAEAEKLASLVQGSDDE
jgi:cell division protein FtsI (penicillin-binding protein 3)